MFNCVVCKNILDYNINLKSLNMRNNLNELPEGIRIGIKRQFLNIREDNNKIILPFSLDLVGMFEDIKNINDIEINKNLKEEIEKKYEENEENLAFKINVIYDLIIDTNGEINEEDKNSRDLKDYAYFLLEPTLKDLVASIGGKIGLPGLTLPKKYRNGKNDNND